MYVKERILHENRTLHLHTMYKRHRAGVKGMETVTQPSQQIKEIEGKYGAIKVFQSQRSFKDGRGYPFFNCKSSVDETEKTGQQRLVFFVSQ